MATAPMRGDPGRQAPPGAPQQSRSRRYPSSRPGPCARPGGGEPPGVEPRPEVRLPARAPVALSIGNCVAAMAARLAEHRRAAPKRPSGPEAAHRPRALRPHRHSCSDAVGATPAVAKSIDVATDGLERAPVGHVWTTLSEHPSCQCEVRGPWSPLVRPGGAARGTHPDPPGRLESSPVTLILTNTVFSLVKLTPLFYHYNIYIYI